MNTLIMTHTPKAVKPVQETETQIGYRLYVACKPISWCDTIAQARGWLLAQWQESCAHAAEWGVKPVGVHPRHLTDEDVAGIIAQSEELAESYYWEERRRGY